MGIKDVPEEYLTDEYSLLKEPEKEIYFKLTELMSRMDNLKEEIKKYEHNIKTSGILIEQIRSARDGLITGKSLTNAQIEGFEQSVSNWEKHTMKN